jgi:hypothetical protein
VVANSAAVSAPDVSRSASVKRFVVFAAHSSNDSRPSPLVSSFANALRRDARYSSRVTLASRSLS